jgi:hypothetical protein
VSQVAALLVDALEDPKLKGAIGTAHAHTLICPHTHTHLYVHTHTHTYMSTHTRTLLCTLICTHMLMYRRALICIYMYLSTYLEIRTLRFTQTSSSIYFITLFAFLYFTCIHLTTAYSIFFYSISVKLLGILFKDTAVLKMVSDLSVKVIEEKNVIDVSFVNTVFYCFYLTLFLHCAVSIHFCKLLRLKLNARDVVP